MTKPKIRINVPYWFRRSEWFPGVGSLFMISHLYNREDGLFSAKDPWYIPLAILNSLYHGLCIGYSLKYLKYLFGR